MADVLEDRCICFDEEEARIILSLIRLVEEDNHLDEGEKDIKKELKRFLKRR